MNYRAISNIFSEEETKQICLFPGASPIMYNKPCFDPTRLVTEQIKMFEKTSFMTKLVIIECILSIA